MAITLTPEEKMQAQVMGYDDSVLSPEGWGKLDQNTQERIRGSLANAAPIPGMSKVYSRSVDPATGAIYTSGKSDDPSNINVSIGGYNVNGAVTSTSDPHTIGRNDPRFKFFEFMMDPENAGKANPYADLVPDFGKTGGAGVAPPSSSQPFQTPQTLQTQTPITQTAPAQTTQLAPTQKPQAVPEADAAEWTQAAKPVNQLKALGGYSASYDPAKPVQQLKSLY